MAAVRNVTSAILSKNDADRCGLGLEMEVRSVVDMSDEHRIPVFVSVSNKANRVPLAQKAFIYRMWSAVLAGRVSSNSIS